MIQTGDISHYRAPYKDSVMSGYGAYWGTGAVLTADVSDVGGVATLTPDYVTAYMDSLQGMGVANPTHSDAPLMDGAELVPQAAAGAPRATGWVTQMANKGLYVLVPRNLDTSKPGSSLVATKDPAVLKLYAGIGGSGGYAVLVAPRSGLGRYLGIGAAVLLGLVVVKMVMGKKKGTYAKNARGHRRTHRNKSRRKTHTKRSASGKGRTYKISTPEGNQVVLGKFASLAAAKRAYVKMMPADWRSLAYGPY